MPREINEPPEDDRYVPKELFIVDYRVNRCSIYRVEIERSTRYLWHIKDGGKMFDAVAGEKESRYFGKRIDKRECDWFFYLSEAKRFAVKKIEGMIERLEARAESLRQVIKDLEQ